MRHVWPKLGNEAQYQSKFTTDIIGEVCNAVIFLVSVINFLDFADKLIGVGMKFAPARRMMDAISAQQIMDN